MSTAAPPPPDGPADRGTASEWSSAAAGTGSPGSGAPRRVPGVGRALAEYTALRVVVLAGAYGLLLVLGVRAFPAIVGALLVSALVSLALFRRQRDAVALALAARSESRRDERTRSRRLLDDGRDGSEGGRSAGG